MDENNSQVLNGNWREHRYVSSEGTQTVLTSVWKSSAFSFFLSRVPEGITPSGLCKDCMASEGQWHRKVGLLLPFLFRRPSADVFCWDSGHCYSNLPSLSQYSSHSPDWWHWAIWPAYAISEFWDSIKYIYIHLILYLECFSLDHMNR